jgi:hypothetical protein
MPNLSSTVTLNSINIDVLEALSLCEDWMCLTVAGIDARLEPRGLTRDEILASCRKLKMLDLAYFSNGLWSEDGVPVGSGYGITQKGRDLLRKEER